MEDYGSEWKPWNKGGHFPIPAAMGKCKKRKWKKAKKRRK